MIETLNLIIIALSAFIATNIDDIFVLMILFSNKDYKSYEIILGQYFGFFTLILISLTAYWLKFVVSNQFLAFLGIFPIIIGLKKLLDYYKQENTPYLSFQKHKINQKDEKEEISGEKAGKIEENHYYMENIEKFPPPNSFLKKKYGYSSALAVSLITISNGGDNIGIYAPLFASYDINELLITMAVFFVMVGVWCVISKNLVRNSIFKEKIGIYEKYLHLLMPLVLIGLGIIIIIFNAF
jgi:cadmium resistance protein CadD (predicted permease)